MFICISLFSCLEQPSLHAHFPYIYNSNLDKWDWKLWSGLVQVVRQVWSWPWLAMCFFRLEVPDLHLSLPNHLYPSSLNSVVYQSQRSPSGSMPESLYTTTTKYLIAKQPFTLLFKVYFFWCNKYPFMLKMCWNSKKKVTNSGSKQPLTLQWSGYLFKACS